MANKANILSFAKAKDASRRGRVHTAETSRSSRSTAAGHSSRLGRPVSNIVSSRRSAPTRSSYSAELDKSRLLDRSLELEDEREHELTRDQSNTARNTRDNRRKKRSKAKADRMYSRQFADEGGSSPDNAPRAALYKGQMGSKQKKAARMQGSLPRVSLPSFSPTNLVREKASGLAVGASLSPLSLKALTAVICLVLICLFLYSPAQQYYHSVRENARLSTEYASIESRNDALDVQNDILVSEAGREDTVRQRFGYVRSGESLGVVVGLSEEATNSLRDSENIEANVLSSSVKAPEEWYTPLLDALFGVE